MFTTNMGTRFSYPYDMNIDESATCAEIVDSVDLEAQNTKQNTEVVNYVNLINLSIKS